MLSVEQLAVALVSKDDHGVPDGVAQDLQVATFCEQAAARERAKHEHNNSSEDTVFVVGDYAHIEGKLARVSETLDVYMYTNDLR